MNRRHLLTLAASALLLTGCDEPKRKKKKRPLPRVCPPGEPCPYRTVRLDEIPIVNPPENSRVRNYKGGSCFHASIQQVMVMQGFREEALEYRAAHWGAAGTHTIANNLDREGFRFAYTDNGDVAFLEWCMRTRRGAAIEYKKNHAITLVHLDREQAIVLDNNTPDRYDDPIPRDTFLARWRGFGGGAITVVYSPLPPLPSPDLPAVPKRVRL